ncbi:hypothetical protein BDB01DRAFT_501064 [Pilobolus umbonatus]|nr:hypothetical protein BDB01DRAFT_501064 [Pilobolus umbonatus]
MQVEQNICTSSIRSKRRPSYINLSNINNTLPSDILSPRTPRSIVKTRRSSIVADHVQDVIQSDSRPSSRRGSLSNYNNSFQFGPNLLSESTSSYFQELAALDENSDRLDTQYIKPTPSIEDIKNFHRQSKNSTLVGSGTRTPSIASIVGPGHTQNFDVHTLYKLKTTRSSKKLDHFFGEYAPHDICIQEIRKEGLKAILESKAPLSYFLYHLLEEYNSENLFFFIELEQYETFKYASVNQQLNTAQHIVNTYLTRNSYFEVNLDDKVRRAVMDALEKRSPQNCFSSAKRAVYALLESSYMRFVNTWDFQDMVDNCELTTHYNDEQRVGAVNKLLLHIEHQQSHMDSNLHTPLFSSLTHTTKRRHELIKSMVREFCVSFLGVEFSYCQQDNNDINQNIAPGTQRKDQSIPANKFRLGGFSSFSNHLHSGNSSSKKKAC